MPSTDIDGTPLGILSLAELDALRRQLTEADKWLRLVDRAIDEAVGLSDEGLRRVALDVLRDYQALRKACVEAATGGRVQ